eukprot:TRINITY_DN20929_c0_g1_i1.p1 TRINITY_DN20929_c0_g1~~TRINITY_DN20929_c0_g1_i1.p1  ORF type:complete len:322 (+),score=52.44 TRINITY_DN20929_c0_g1_i1:70-966(+)
MARAALAEPVIFDTIASYWRTSELCEAARACSQFAASAVHIICRRCGPGSDADAMSFRILDTMDLQREYLERYADHIDDLDDYGDEHSDEEGDENNLVHQLTKLVCSTCVHIHQLFDVWEEFYRCTTDALVQAAVLDSAASAVARRRSGAPKEIHPNAAPEPTGLGPGQYAVTLHRSETGASLGLICSMSSGTPTVTGVTPAAPRSGHPADPACIPYRGWRVQAIDERLVATEEDFVSTPRRSGFTTIVFGGVVGADAILRNTPRGPIQRQLLSLQARFHIVLDHFAFIQEFADEGSE